MGLSLVDVGGLLFVWLWLVVVVSVIVLLILLLPVQSILHADSKPGSISHQSDQTLTSQ